VAASERHAISMMPSAAIMAALVSTVACGPGFTTEKSQSGAHAKPEEAPLQQALTLRM